MAKFCPETKWKAKSYLAFWIFSHTVPFLKVDISPNLIDIDPANNVPLSSSLTQQTALTTLVDLLEECALFTFQYAFKIAPHVRDCDR